MKTDGPDRATSHRVYRRFERWGFTASRRRDYLDDRGAVSGSLLGFKTG
jgi:hypothetical protein